MTALIDDVDQQQIDVKSEKPISTLAWLRQALTDFWANQKRNKADKIALRQLMQLDDALLKDMGLSRHELISVSKRSATFDSLIKQNILSNRDNACSTTSLRK